MKQPRRIGDARSAICKYPGAENRICPWSQSSTLTQRTCASCAAFRCTAAARPSWTFSQCSQPLCGLSQPPRRCRVLPTSTRTCLNAPAAPGCGTHCRAKSSPDVAAKWSCRPPSARKLGLRRPFRRPVKPSELPERYFGPPFQNKQHCVAAPPARWPSPVPAREAALSREMLPHV